MATVMTDALSARPTRVAQGIPPLESGAHLGAAEFLRRYEAMPEVTRRARAPA